MPSKKTSASVLKMIKAVHLHKRLILEDAQGFRTYFDLLPTNEEEVSLLHLLHGSMQGVALGGKSLLKSSKQDGNSAAASGHAASGRELMKKLARFNSDLIVFMTASDGAEDTVDHSHFVAAYTLLLAQTLGIQDQHVLTGMKRGALLHDIGKSGVPLEILNKTGPLTAIEREAIKDHPLLGYKMIRDFDFLKEAAEIVLAHHERYDGRGYPYGIAGGKIPLGARIFALADTLDAITSNRPYRKGRSLDEALFEIERCRKSQFDPQLVDAFLSITKKQWIRAKLDALNSLSLPAVH